MTGSGKRAGRGAGREHDGDQAVPEYVTPGVYFERVDAAPPLVGARTDVAGFVGLAQRGPLGGAVRVDSWPQFQSRFGSFVPWAFLAYGVKAFFENGGRTCFVARVAGPSAAATSFVLVRADGTPVMKVEALDAGTWARRQLAVSVVNVRPAEKQFSLHVIVDRALVESFPDLSADPGGQLFVRAINEGTRSRGPSRWVRVTDLLAGSGSVPDPVRSGMVGGTAFFDGGDDGLASLATADFLGTRGPAPAGLAALAEVEAVAILAVPDIHVRPEELPPPAPPRTPPPHDPCCPLDQPAADPVAPPPPPAAPDAPPVFTDAQVLAVQRAMIEQCEMLKNRVAVVEVPLVQGSMKSRTVQGALDWRNQLASDRGFAALYYPWVKVIDPLLDGAGRPVPPCGHVAGVYARADLTRGVHKAPANEETLWAEDLTAPVDERNQGVLNPAGVNCLRAFPGRGVRCYGGRTISTDLDWRYVNVRRLMCMIQTTLARGMQWSVFEPNDWPLRQALVTQVTTFLDGLWRRGALVGRSAEEAFFVRCDETNNPQADVDNGRLNVDVGVAPTLPAEFVVFRIGRTAEELEVVER